MGTEASGCRAGTLIPGRADTTMTGTEGTGRPAGMTLLSLSEAALDYNRSLPLGFWHSERPVIIPSEEQLVHCELCCMPALPLYVRHTAGDHAGTVRGSGSLAERGREAGRTASTAAAAGSGKGTGAGMTGGSGSPSPGRPKRSWCGAAATEVLLSMSPCPCLARVLAPAARPGISETVQCGLRPRLLHRWLGLTLDVRSVSGVSNVPINLHVNQSISAGG